MIEAEVNYQQPETAQTEVNPIDLIADENLKNLLISTENELPPNQEYYTIKQIVSAIHIPGAQKTELNLRMHNIIPYYHRSQGQGKLLYDKMGALQIAAFRYTEMANWGFRTLYTTSKPVDETLKLLGSSPIAEGILPPDKNREPRVKKIDSNLKTDTSQRKQKAKKIDAEENSESKKTEEVQIKAQEKITSIQYLRDLDDSDIKKFIGYNADNLRELRDNIDPRNDIVSDKIIAPEIATITTAVGLLMDEKTQHIDPGSVDMTCQQAIRSLNFSIKLMQENPQFKTYAHLLLRLRNNLRKIQEKKDNSATI